MKELENLINQYLTQLLDFNAGHDELRKLNSVTLLSKNTIAEIKAFLQTHQFESEQEEIEFFKSMNPKVLAPPIEEGLKYSILINKPIDTNEALIAYFENALKNLQNFFSMNNFFYQYFKNNFMELDHIYFNRNAGPVTIPVVEIPMQGTEYYPAMSFLFAKFMAYQNVQRYILEEIGTLKTSYSNSTLPVSHVHDPAMKWTGDAINVVELAYGLWLTGQLNNGNASLNQIVRFLEKNLNVSIGIAQRKFAQITRRKRISITKFIDQMHDAIQKKIDEDFE